MFVTVLMHARLVIVCLEPQYAMVGFVVDFVDMVAGLMVMTWSSWWLWWSWCMMPLWLLFVIFLFLFRLTLYVFGPSVVGGVCSSQAQSTSHLWRSFGTIHISSQHQASLHSSHPLGGLCSSKLLAAGTLQLVWIHPSLSTHSLHSFLGTALGDDLVCAPCADRAEL